MDQNRLAAPCMRMLAAIQLVIGEIVADFDRADRRPRIVGFVKSTAGAVTAASEHAKILDKTYKLMTSKQMEAFKVGSEPADVKERYPPATQ